MKKARWAMRFRNWGWGLFVVVAASCGTEAAPTRDALDDVDASPQQDTVAPLDVDDAAGEIPDAELDTVSADDVAAETVTGDAATDTQGGDALEPPGPIEAVVGARCDEAARIGVVAIERQDFPEVHFTLGAGINAAAHPGVNAPAIERDTCAYFVQASGCTETCRGSEVCAATGVCVAWPGPYGAFTLTAEAGGATQDFEAAADTGRADGELTLTGATFAFRVSLGDAIVVLPAIAVPNSLTDVQGTLLGDYDIPERVDITWSGGEAGAFVTTTVPINHHVGGNTFTRCDVPSEAGSMSVPGEMLKPLAVVTGLEFQGIEHIRFAAATIPAGCIEFRFLSRAYVPLF